MQTTEQKVNAVIDHILYLAKRREEIDQELTKERAELIKLVFPAQEQHNVADQTVRSNDR